MRLPTVSVCFAGVTVLLVVGWANVARAQCTKDIECKGDRLCRDGVCADPVLAPAATKDDDAPGAVPGPAPAEKPERQEADAATPTKARSPEMQTTGIVLTALGTATLVATVALAVDAHVMASSADRDCVDNACRSVSDVDRLDQAHSLGTASVFMGLVTIPLLGVGIPLWVAGAHRVGAQRRGTSWWMPLEVRAGLQQVRVTFAF